jgi:hypothetical protein
VSMQVEVRHFHAALERVTPSVSRKDQRLYDQMQKRLRSARARISAGGEGGPGQAGKTEGGQRKLGA